MPDYLDLAARVFLGIVGAAMVLHYAAMAGYVNRAPLVVRALILPVLVCLGAFIVGCSIKGYTDIGMVAAALSSLPMLALYLTVWAAGLHVSAVFEQQAQDRDHERMRFYVGQAVDGYEFVAHDIVTDSGLAELKAAQRREKERA